MNESEAIELIRGAIPAAAGNWADLGAGEGTFTRALAALLGPGSRVWAVDRDARALASLRRRPPGGPAAEVVTLTADFTRPLGLPGLGEGSLDGILLANALHFVPDPEAVLGRLVERLAPGGRLVVIEYDRRRASRWVPHPIPPARLRELAARAGLTEPVVVAQRPSAFGGDLYVAVADRLPGGSQGGPAPLPPGVRPQSLT